MKTGKTKSLAIILILFTLLTGFGNWYMRRVVNDSYYVQLSYNQLYTDPSSVRLKNAEQEGDKLIIELAGTTTGMSSNLDKNNISNNGSFTFSSADTGRIFWIKPANQPDSIRFSIDYSSETSRRLASRIGGNTYEIRSSSLNYADSKLYDTKTWSYDFSRGQDTDNLVEIKKYIKDSIGINGTETSLEKIQKIFAHVMPFVRMNLGIPADSVSGMSPINLLSCMKTKKVKVWCEDLTRVLGFLATQAGLPSRIVTTEGYDKFSFAVHSFNEIFLPEKNRWIYSDLTNGIAYVSNNKDQLNIIDIHRLARLHTRDTSLKALYYDSSLHETGFDKIAAIADKWFNSPHRFRFYFSKYLEQAERKDKINRVRKIFDPHLNYAFYNEDNHYSSSSFFLRKISTYLLLVIVLVDIFFLLTILRKAAIRPRQRQ